MRSAEKYFFEILSKLSTQISLSDWPRLEKYFQKLIYLALLVIAAIVVVPIAAATIATAARCDERSRAKVNGRHASGAALALGLSVVFLCLLKN